MDWKLFIVTPLWAVLSAVLFLQGLLAAINLVIAITALVKGIIPPRNFMAATIASCVAALVFFSLLIVGFYVFTVKMPLGQTPAAPVVYDAVALLAALYMIPRLWVRIKKHWREYMVPGSAEFDAAIRGPGADRDGE